MEKDHDKFAEVIESTLDRLDPIMKTLSEMEAQPTHYLDMLKESDRPHYTKALLDVPMDPTAPEGFTLREDLMDSMDYFGCGHVNLDELPDEEIFYLADFLEYLWTK